LQSLQTLERDLVRAQRTLVERRVDLYRSIAGGWKLTQPELAQTSGLTDSAANSQEAAQDQ
jgi:hypothetical protein